MVLRFGVPGVLVGLALGWSPGAGRTPEAKAQSTLAQAEPARSPRERPIAEANGTIAFTSNGPGAGQLLYLIDTRSQTFAVYRVDPQNTKGIVKLEAARHYQWDLKLSEYNNLPPEVAAIESMVRTTTR
jgi:hypothetical protein